MKILGELIKIGHLGNQKKKNTPHPEGVCRERKLTYLDAHKVAITISSK